MKKRLLSLGLVFALAFAFVGCGGDKKSDAPKSESEAPAATENQATPASEPAADDPASPEGVTNLFFKAFFTGDDSGAFALLTPTAQEVTKETFSAEASDTIKWKINKKTIENGVASVSVEVEDLNEQGEYAREELVFVLKNNDRQWRVAGFAAGDLVVNFEQRMIGSTAGNQEQATAENQEPIRVGQKDSEQSVR